MDTRHGLPHRCRQEVEALPDLVLDGDSGLANFVRREQELDAVLDVADQHFSLLRGMITVTPILQERRDSLLVEQDRTAASFRGVSSKRGLDVELPNKRERFLQRLALHLQLVNRIRYGLAPRAFFRRGLRPLPIYAHDLQLLSFVDQVEKRGVGTQHGEKVVRFCFFDDGSRLVKRFLLAQMAKLLDQSEDFFSVPRPNCPPQHGAEQIDLPRERR